MKDKNGFSLVELMTVVCIVGIISIITLTGFKFFWQKSQSEIVSAQLMSAIHLARSEAVLRHNKIILCGSVDQIACSDQWQQGYLIKSTDQMIYHFPSVSKGILHWRSFPKDKPQLEFLADGFPNSENGTFWFCLSDAEKPVWAIVLSQSGRARIVYPDREGNIKDKNGKVLVC